MLLLIILGMGTSTAVKDSLCIITDLVISPHFETQKMDILWLITVQNELIAGISS